MELLGLVVERLTAGAVGGAMKRLGSWMAGIFTRRPSHAPALPSYEDQRHVMDLEREVAEQARRLQEIEHQAAMERTARAQQMALQSARRAREELEEKNRMIEQLHERHRQQRVEFEMYPLPEFLADAHYENTINIAVTGNSGAGKSTMINALRNIRNDNQDPRAARVDVRECTMEPTPYPFPESDAVRLWDLPGAHTCRFPSHKYVRCMGLRHFDAVIVACCTRLTETEDEIIRELRHHGVPFFVVRTKVDFDVHNHCQDNQHQDSRASESQMLRLLRIEAREWGIEENRFFLVNSKNPSQYDMPSLLRALRTVIMDRDIKKRSHRCASPVARREAERDWDQVSDAGTFLSDNSDDGCIHNHTGCERDWDQDSIGSICTGIASHFTKDTFDSIGTKGTIHTKSIPRDKRSFFPRFLRRGGS